MSTWRGPTTASLYAHRPKVDISYTTSVIEIYHKGKRVASHMRVNKPGAFVTDPLHMPHDHRRYLGVDSGQDQGLGEKIGPHTKTLMEEIMEHRGPSGARLQELSRSHQTLEALYPRAGGAGLQKSP